jgi:HlyD family secretion protein
MIVPKIARGFLLSSLVLVAAGTGCDRRSEGSQAAGTPRSRRESVTAFGRVTPGRSVMSIAAQPGNRILKLTVTDGQKVKAGDALAYLETHALKAAELEAARVSLEEAKARMEAETVYGQAIIEQTQRAVDLLEVSVTHERQEVKRLEPLTSGKAVPEQRLDDQKFLLATREGELAKAQAELRAAKAALARTRTLVAVKSAEAQVAAAEAQLALTIIRAPINGEILKILTYPGEQTGSAPILKMGNTADMHVIAEVHESDVGLVRIGQRATITSDALAEPVQGVVEEIGAIIFKNDVLDIDPRAEKDTRVVEVRVKLDKPEPLSRLIHHEVSTRIDVSSPGISAKSTAR